MKKSVKKVLWFVLGLIVIVSLIFIVSSQLPQSIIHEIPQSISSGGFLA